MDSRTLTVAALLPLIGIALWLAYTALQDHREFRREAAMWEDLIARVRRGDFDGGDQA